MSLLISPTTLSLPSPPKKKKLDLNVDTYISVKKKLNLGFESEHIVCPGSTQGFFFFLRKGVENKTQQNRF